MEVHGHHPIHVGRAQEIGHQLCPYRYAGLILTILPRPAEVGHYRNHLVGRSPVGCIGQQQQLKEILYRREGALDDENGCAPHRFVKRGLKLPVAKLQH